MRKWMAVAGVAALAAVGGVVLTQSLRDDKATPTPAPTTTLAPATTVAVPVPYDPNTGVVGTVPPVDPNAGEGILSSGGT